MTMGRLDAARTAWQRMRDRIRDRIDPRLVAFERSLDPGGLTAAAVGLLLLGFALSVDFPRAAYGFQSDESTYYSLAHSLAEDFDFAFEREDLTRVWKEFPTGPEGIFLKRGKDVEVDLESSFPFVSWETDDLEDQSRLYYGKSYIYPLVAAPFVWAFGTNGFLVLHALLAACNLWLAYMFLAARSKPSAALAYAIAFFAASAAPVYFVWLTPEFFNLSMVLVGIFFWCYKEVAPPLEASAGRWLHLLMGPGSDYVAAAVLGIATFSKPINVLVILPLVAVLAYRRRWVRSFCVGSRFGAVVVGLFLVNVVITGEFNYQGGDRKTFYGVTGFPFQNAEASFETVGLDRATDSVPVEVLFSRDAFLHVLRWNLLYVVAGRHTGLIPYFFPGVLSFVLFLAAGRRREPWQWFVAGTVGLGVLALITYMPFTYSGGGGPVGNRYFLGFYPLLLFVTPPLASVRAALAAVAVGGLFTAQVVLNPFYTSFHPAEHPKSGPLRLLPVELSLLNDLPINVTPSRIKQPLGGDPPIQAYFLDNNAHRPEGTAFWVRGESRADVALRAPARLRPDGGYDSLQLDRLMVHLSAGGTATTALVAVGGNEQRVTLAQGETKVVELDVGPGLPYRPVPGQPTNYVYITSISSDRGFVPLFTTGSRDSRFLGVMVTLEPVYRQGGGS